MPHDEKSPIQLTSVGFTHAHPKYKGSSSGYLLTFAIVCSVHLFTNPFFLSLDLSGV